VAHLERIVGKDVGFADIDESAEGRSASPRMLEEFTAEGVEDDVDAAVGCGVEHVVGKTSLSAMEDVVVREAVKLLDQLALPLTSYCDKDVRPAQLRKLNSSLLHSTSSSVNQHALSLAQPGGSDDRY
jgi:hypothetical protein